jgi:hypothetical protein
MSVSEEKMNPYDPPPEAVERGLVSAKGLTELSFACIAMALISLGASGHAMLRILETTPAMGIRVDANGNPIPIQGYTQLSFGLAGSFLFTVLAVGLRSYRGRQQWARQH